MVLRVVIRTSSRRLRQAFSFGTSGSIHGLLLLWLVWAAAMPPAAPEPSLYDLAIKPYEKHIVWYNLHDKLPNVKSGEAVASHKSTRAREKFNQSIVAGRKDDNRPAQKILMPAPAIEIPKPLPLPNVLAVKETSRLREFAPPVSAGHPTAPAPVLPEAPQLDGLKSKPVDLTAAAARPLRAFVAPEAKKIAAPAAPVVIPEAPRLAAAATKPVDLAAASSHPLRSFLAPPEKKAATPAAPVVIPEAPRMSLTTAAVTLPVGIPGDAPRRAFVPPEARPHSPAPESRELAAPQLGPAAPISAALPRIPHGFTPPPARQQSSQPSPVALPEAPEVPAAGRNASATLAIVGLNPTRTMEIPPPPGSHDAGFSAGVKPDPSNSEATVNEAASITVPGLSTNRGPAPDRAATISAPAPPNARQNLLAALHERIPASVMSIRPSPAAVRMATPPDARLTGRFVYALAIQMPNVTSYSGSWTVWFAEHQPEPGEAPAEIKPPVAVRKVDPKYVQAAVEERVEGTVRLAAIIRKTGHVESVELLKHLDARLDRSAEEALAKWEFEPASRNGSPVDIDAVFEIPFRLAPKPKR